MRLLGYILLAVATVVAAVGLGSSRSGSQAAARSPLDRLRRTGAL